MLAIVRYSRPVLVLILVVPLACLTGFTVPSSAATQAKPSSSKASKSTKTKTPTKTSTKRRSASKKRTAAARKQQAPAPERIKEIQSALSTRGYNCPDTGKWDTQTVEALKKFQEDQNIKNLTGAGKLDSLTLIALGLGPQNSQAAASGQPEGKNP